MQLNLAVRDQCTSLLLHTYHGRDFLAFLDIPNTFSTPHIAAVPLMLSCRVLH